MNIFIVALITIIFWQLITVVIAQFSEEKALLFATCFVFMTLRFLFYPCRSLKAYSRSEEYYRKHGISKIAYLFGKRAKKERQ